VVEPAEAVIVVPPVLPSPVPSMPVSEVVGADVEVEAVVVVASLAEVVLAGPPVCGWVTLLSASPREASEPEPQARTRAARTGQGIRMGTIEAPAAGIRKEFAGDGTRVSGPPEGRGS